MAITTYSSSTIAISSTEFVVPQWIMDDVEHFYPIISDWIKRETEFETTFDILYLNQFIQLRKQIYWQCNWNNELVDAKIPMIPSEVFCTNNNEQSMVSILYKQLNSNPKFVRFCNASPKDATLPIFTKDDDVDDIMDIFKASHRTAHMLHDSHHTHLILKPAVEIDYEVRCFWHKYKLRAVGGPEFHVDDDKQQLIKKLVLRFFDEYGKKITYNSATIDLGIHSNKVFIIELNSFGSDMLAGAGHFKWTDDFMKLYNSNVPVFKFKDEFAWDNCGVSDFKYQKDTHKYTEFAELPERNEFKSTNLKEKEIIDLNKLLSKAEYTYIPLN
jgi:hypothetical protein